MLEAHSDLSVTACDSTPVVMSDPVNTTNHASETDLNQNGMYLYYLVCTTVHCKSVYLLHYFYQCGSTVTMQVLVCLPNTL